MTYTYDGDGRRVMKQQGGNTTTYWYEDAGRVLLEVINSSNREYLYVNGEMLAKIFPGSLTKYHFRDHLGSLRVFSERDGSQV